MNKFVVITRTKNRPQFLERALGSVQGQTFRDFVHVIVNDGGDPNQVESIVEKYKKPHANVVVVHRATASNAPDTIFNEAIDHTNSKYIAIHDDDDTWHAEFLERAAAALDAGAQGVLVRTDKVIETIGPKGEIKIVKRTQYLPDLNVVSIYRQFAENQLTPISFAYTRKAYEEVGKYDVSLPVVGDWEFGIRFLLKNDVDFLDPGFSLASYHHRKNTKDNSFAVHNHRIYFNKVANKYLREELEQGQIGPGYIISKIRYDQAYISRVTNALLPTGIVKRIKKRV